MPCQTLRYSFITFIPQGSRIWWIWNGNDFLFSYVLYFTYCSVCFTSSRLIPPSSREHQQTEMYILSCISIIIQWRSYWHISVIFPSAHLFLPSFSWMHFSSRINSPSLSFFNPWMMYARWLLLHRLSAKQTQLSSPMYSASLAPLYSRPSLHFCLSQAIIPAPIIPSLLTLAAYSEWDGVVPEGEHADWFSLELFRQVQAKFPNAAPSLFLCFMHNAVMVYNWR